MGGFGHLSFFHFLGKMLGKALHEVSIVVKIVCEWKRFEFYKKLNTTIYFSIFISLVSELIILN